MAYDIKYRRRALDYMAEGHTFRATAEIFKVSTSTLQEWKSQLKETGDLAPKKRRETWRKIDPQKLSEYVEAHPDAYLKEIASAFGCWVSAVEKALRRLKISRKKNGCIPREM